MRLSKNTERQKLIVKKLVRIAHTAGNSILLLQLHFAEVFALHHTVNLAARAAITRCTFAPASDCCVCASEKSIHQQDVFVIFGAGEWKFCGWPLAN